MTRAHCPVCRTPQLHELTPDGPQCQRCLAISRVFPGMLNHVEQQEESAAEVSGEELSAKMREPLADISRKTGKLEKDSPLFFGTGENPGLFNQ